MGVGEGCGASAAPGQDAGAGRVTRVSAVVLRDEAGRRLTVRKQGTARFMLPGGKPEPGETDAEAAVREVGEEVGVVLDPARLGHWGTWRVAAANEPGEWIEAAVFEHPTVPGGQAAGEIAELRWVDLGSRPLAGDLAPLTVSMIARLDGLH